MKRPAVPVIDPLVSSDITVLCWLAAQPNAAGKAGGSGTLIRRLSFGLAGLPPSPGEVEAFVNSASPDAYRELADGLLASPRFGERWAGWMLPVRRPKGYLAGNQARLFTHSYTYRLRHQRLQQRPAV